MLVPLQTLVCLLTFLERICVFLPLLAVVIFFSFILITSTGITILGDSRLLSVNECTFYGQYRGNLTVCGCLRAHTSLAKVQWWISVLCSSEFGNCQWHFQSTPSQHLHMLRRCGPFFLLTNVVLFHRADYYWMCYFWVLANTDGYSEQISWSLLKLWILLFFFSSKDCTITGFLSAPSHECHYRHSCLIVLFLRGLQSPIRKVLLYNVKFPSISYHWMMFMIIETLWNQQHVKC